MSRTDAILKRLTTLYPKFMDLSLDRQWRLLGQLGNPQDRVPPVIHVPGTNAKGSTIAYLRAFLEAAGKRVHVYTSPHLVRFNERIRLAGKLVSTRRINDALEEVERINAGQPITQFEITPSAAISIRPMSSITRSAPSSRRSISITRNGSATPSPRSPGTRPAF